MASGSGWAGSAHHVFGGPRVAVEAVVTVTWSDGVLVESATRSCRNGDAGRVSRWSWEGHILAMGSAASSAVAVSVSRRSSRRSSASVVGTGPVAQLGILVPWRVLPAARRCWRLGSGTVQPEAGVGGESATRQRTPWAGDPGLIAAICQQLELLSCTRLPKPTSLGFPCWELSHQCQCILLCQKCTFLCLAQFCFWVISFGVCNHLWILLDYQLLHKVNKTYTSCLLDGLVCRYCIHVSGFSA